MTVSYNSDVSSVSSANFFKLLLRWKGSIWKSVSGELMVWSIAYSLVAVIYHLVLYPNKVYSSFNDVSSYFDGELKDSIPLTFMLAFFVSIVVERWRTTFTNMGWIETTALTINAFVAEKSEEAVLMKRNIIRYLVLAQILSFRDISIRVRRRFPNIDSICKAGFLTDEEACKLEDINLVYNKYWVPINWAIALVHRSNVRGFFIHAPGHVAVITEIKTFRSNLATICNFDWVPVPIAYPQVVFFAVRIYFVLCLITRQYTRKENEDFHVIQLLIRPFITIIELVCVVGWMKVAEGLLNPLGEDDDDFETNFLIDKNIFTGMKIVDECDNVPEMFHDHFSDRDAAPVYSVDSRKHQSGVLVGSVSNVALAQMNEDIAMVPVNPRLSIGDISGIEFSRPSIRRRFHHNLGSVSTQNSVSRAKLPKQISVGELNDAYNMEPDLRPTSPKSGRLFLTNLPITSLPIVEEENDMKSVVEVPGEVSRI